MYHGGTFRSLNPRHFSVSHTIYSNCATLFVVVRSLHTEILELYYNFFENIFIRFIFVQFNHHPTQPNNLSPTKFLVIYDLQIFCTKFIVTFILYLSRFIFLDISNK
jgi:hypothetical protein